MPQHRVLARHKTRASAWRADPQGLPCRNGSRRHDRTQDKLAASRFGVRDAHVDMTRREYRGCAARDQRDEPWSHFVMSPPRAREVIRPRPPEEPERILSVRPRRTTEQRQAQRHHHHQYTLEAPGHGRPGRGSTWPITARVLAPSVRRSTERFAPRRNHILSAAALRSHVARQAASHVERPLAAVPARWCAGQRHDELAGAACRFGKCNDPQDDSAGRQRERGCKAGKRCLEIHAQ